MSNGDKEETGGGAESRFWLTNDGLAVVIVLAFISYIFVPMTPWVDGYPEVNVIALGAFVTAFGVVIAWLYGPQAVRAWTQRNTRDEE